MVDAQPIEEQTLLGYKHKRYYPIKIGQTLTNQYATVKVCIEQKDVEDSPVLNEVNALQRMKKFADAADHPGLCFTRLARDIFEVTSPQGRHYCIASKPQGHSLGELQAAFPDAKVPNLLNVLTELGDDSSLEYIEEQESVNPSIPVTGNSNTPVYPSRTPLLELSGITMLTDFGQAREVEGVLLQQPWSYPVDLWSVGVMTLELLEGKNLFDPIDRIHGQYVLPLVLAQYIGTFVTTIPPGQEKDIFLKFIRNLLTWDPETRASANGIIPDEWLMRPNLE
ncbi:hypothetical protein BJX62DRAFT_230734 [Aspergillus germanicus]